MLRGALYALLVAVAAAAAVLSFTTLRDLALACGFAAGTAWLLPLVVDAGAAAGSLAWLSRAGRARGFGRVLALVLLGLSVVGNALSHGLAAEGLRPGWVVVVAVSAVAPAVLGAVVHLAVLALRPEPASERELEEPSGAAVLRAEREPIEVAAGPERATVAELVAAQPDVAVDRERADELIKAGLGRRRLAAELDISEDAARKLITEYRERVAA